MALFEELEKLSANSEVTERVLSDVVLNIVNCVIRRVRILKKISFVEIVEEENSERLMQIIIHDKVHDELFIAHELKDDNHDNPLKNSRAKKKQILQVGNLISGTGFAYRTQLGRISV